jgi:predicted GNAT family N-acyltransferase
MDKMNKKHFCTCTDLDCKFNPHNHSLGCDLCIKKCLKEGEIPSCFFKAIYDDISETKDFTYKGFADFFVKHGKTNEMIVEKISKEETWEIRHKVMWPNKELDYVKLKDDDFGTHYGIFHENQLVSVISLFINNEKAQFRKFATLEQYQGKGYGSKLLKHAINEAKIQGAKTICCNARRNKTSFYKKFGLIETTKIFKKGGTDYIVMEKQLLIKKVRDTND